jgi:hypothetical protein
METNVRVLCEDGRMGVSFKRIRNAEDVEQAKKELDIAYGLHPEHLKQIRNPAFSPALNNTEKPAEPLE